MTRDDIDDAVNELLMEYGDYAINCMSDHRASPELYKHKEKMLSRLLDELFSKLYEAECPF